MHGRVECHAHRLQHCGDEERIVDPLLRDKLPGLRRVESPHQHLGESAVRGDDCGRQGPHVEEGHRVQVAVTDGEVAADVQGGEGGELGAVGVHHSLRQAGSSRCVYLAPKKEPNEYKIEIRRTP